MVPFATIQQQDRQMLKPCHRFSTRISGSDDIPSPCQRTSSTLGDDDSTQKKRVHFSGKHQAHTIICRDDYTAEEFGACWVTQEERTRHYKSFERTIKRMESGKQPKKNCTYRGLEDFLQSNSIDRTVHDCIDAVMDGQERQWQVSLNLIDWDLSREVSLKVSTQSAKHALAMADYDACEACAVNISEEDDDSFEIDEFSQGDEIHQSLKDNANLKQFWHPKKLRRYMRPSR